MNYTTYFYCDCGFEKALSEGNDYQVLQCQNCFTLASSKKEIKYSIQCSACGEEEMIEGDLELGDGEKTCKNCGIKGSVGFKEFQKDSLFFVEVKSTFSGSCERCKKTNWDSHETHQFKCPMCFQILRQKMSSTWEK